MKTKLQITSGLKVSAAHLMGKRATSPVWFQLLDQDDVSVIFQHVSHLKDVTNATGKKFVLREYLTEEDREWKTRKQDLIAENRCLPVSHQVTMQHVKDDLMINGSKCQPVITPPLVKDVLLTPHAETGKNPFKDAGITVGDYKAENGSTFYSYIKEVNSFDEIKKVYQVIKAQHITATHTVCAYRIFGTKFYNLQDYSDDGEIGGGRVLLNILRVESLEYGGLYGEISRRTAVGCEAPCHNEKLDPGHYCVTPESPELWTILKRSANGEDVCRCRER